MSFRSQQNLATFVHGIGVYDHASPTTITFKGRLYVFYVGRGDDGIFYTSMSDWNWSPIKNINDDAKNIGISNNTSPSTVVFQDKIYLFYNGKGDDGTWYTVFDGSRWSSANEVSSKVGGMGFLPGTSPSVAINQDAAIQLFWNGRGDDGIFHASFNGSQWTRAGHINNVGIAPATSPFAVNFNQKLHVFWNGREGDATWYCTFENGSWTKQRSVAAQNGGQGYFPGTSPMALVQDSKRLRLFWVGSGGPGQGLWYSDLVLNPYSWTAQKNMANEIGGQGLKKGSSATGVKYGQSAYVFWEGLEQEIWFSYELIN